MSWSGASLSTPRPAMSPVSVRTSIAPAASATLALDFAPALMTKRVPATTGEGKFQPPGWLPAASRARVRRARPAHSARPRSQRGQSEPEHVHAEVGRRHERDRGRSAHAVGVQDKRVQFCPAIGRGDGDRHAGAVAHVRARCARRDRHTIASRDFERQRLAHRQVNQRTAEVPLVMSAARRLGDLAASRVPAGQSARTRYSASDHAGQSRPAIRPRNRGLG